MTREDIDDVIRRGYAEGLTREQIGERVGLSAATVGRRAHTLGVTNSNPPSWSEEEKEKVRQWLRDGVPRDVIANRLGRKLTAVRAGIARHALAPSKLEPGDHGLIAELFLSGVPVKVIAEKFDVSWHSVKTVLDRKESRGELDINHRELLQRRQEYRDRCKRAEEIQEFLK